MDFKEIRCSALDWIHLAQDRFYWRNIPNKTLDFGIQQKAGFRDFSRRAVFLEVRCGVRKEII
jgi:hypothetical protein